MGPCCSARLRPARRCVSSAGKAKNGANEAIHFAKRNEPFRTGRGKSLKSLRRRIQPFRRIVCFQWVQAHFVSPFSRRRSFPAKSFRPWAKERSPDLNHPSSVFCNGEEFAQFLIIEIIAVSLLASGIREGGETSPRRKKRNNHGVSGGRWPSLRARLSECLMQARNFLAFYNHLGYIMNP